jgi:hypothetical protein
MSIHITLIYCRSDEENNNEEDWWWERYLKYSVQAKLKNDSSDDMTIKDKYVGSVHGIYFNFQESGIFIWDFMS